MTESDVIEAWRAATPFDAPLAARFYAADMEQMRLRDEVFDLLETVFGADVVDDFSADYYDRSIEARLAARPEAVPDLSPLAAAGFRLLWIHCGCEPRCACQPVALEAE